MNQALKPRPVAADAWKTWLREAARLSRRTAPTLLPIALVVGLGLAAAIGFGGVPGTLLLLVVIAFSGPWQAALLHASERAAQGDRIHAGTAWEGVRWFASQSRDQLWQHLRPRLARVLFLAAVLVAIVALATLWMAAAPPADPNAPSVPTPSRTGLALVWWLCDQWGVVFLWSLAVQGGGVSSLASALVRGHGVDWNQAWHLDTQNRVTNPLPMAGLVAVALGLIVLVMAVPPLVFAVEVFWSALLTVAYRDIYLSQSTLAPQAAREGALQPALLQARQALPALGSR